MDRALSGNRPQSFFQHRLANGDIRDVTMFSGPIQSGDELLLYAIIFDVTEARKAEAALKSSEERFRSLVENSMVGICIIQDGAVAYENPEHRRLAAFFGEPGQNIYQTHVHLSDQARVTKLFDRVLAGRAQSVDTEFKLCKNPRQAEPEDPKWVNFRASRIRHAGKEAILVNVVDITEAKNLEAMIQVKDKMSSLGRVAAGIAHEIRNPLSGINTYLFSLSELLSKEELSGPNLETAGDIARRIRSASVKIESVIRRVIDFSKPHMPKMTASDLNKTVAEAVSLCKVSLRKTGISLEFFLGPNLPLFRFDPQLLSQVVLNLVNNAAAAMEQMEDDKVIRIQTIAKNNQVVLSVSDSGPGIAEHLKHKIFDPFFTTKKDGAGIGLAIVQRIVADHNGAIQVGASVWGGAEFRVELPAEG